MSTNTSSRPSFNRKVIHAAGILIVQPDENVATSWRDALLDFGMSGVRVVSNADSALDLARSAPPSGIIVALPTQAESHALMARLSSGEAGDLRHTPVVLVLEHPTRAAVMAAANVGFDAVLPFPLPPRLIYRRMGSLMQKARRAARLNPSPNHVLVEPLGQGMNH
jgi:DNA-binding NarL/FixJ family response regulator